MALGAAAIGAGLMVPGALNAIKNLFGGGKRGKRGGGAMAKIRKHRRRGRRR